MNTLKVYLSHETYKIDEGEMWKIRNLAEDKLIRILKKNIIIDIIPNYSYIDRSTNHNMLYCLGEKIKKMQQADIIYFCKGWEKSKECVIENEIVKKYCDIYDWTVIHETIDDRTLTKFNRSYKK